tara:strand:- start:2852 stop:3337 length:486 start_codon:yes stop_codon:yes gene_type:complete
MPHHDACWERAGGCLIRGCEGGEKQSTSIQLPPDVPIATPTDEPAPEEEASQGIEIDTLAGKKLGVLLSVGPEHPNFAHSIRLAGTAMEAQLEVFFYCLDDGVTAVDHPELQTMRAAGMRLFACAYGAQRRKIPPNENAIYGGLTMLSDMVYATDRFVSFN